MMEFGWFGLFVTTIRFVNRLNSETIRFVDSVEIIYRHAHLLSVVCLSLWFCNPCPFPFSRSSSVSLFLSLQTLDLFKASRIKHVEQCMPMSLYFRLTTNNIGRASRIKQKQCKTEKNWKRVHCRVVVINNIISITTVPISDALSVCARDDDNDNNDNHHD